jgi:zinc protease
MRKTLALTLLLTACTSQSPTTSTTKPSDSKDISVEIARNQTGKFIINGHESPPKPLVTISQRLLHEPTRRAVKLSNGFTLLLQQNKTAPIVASRIYVKAGSITEQQYMGTGLSHVLEHLVAGASSGKRKESENALLLQQIGNDSNAYTDHDHTVYFITTTADKFPIALDLLADWTTAADFTREQFDREFQVVQREIEMGEAEALRTFYIQAGATRYLENNARHPVIGYKPAFQKLTFEDAKAYYKQMYVPDNMIISIAGDIDLDAAEKLALEKFGSVPRKVVPVIANPPENPVIAPRTTVSRADVKQARVMWTFPTTNLFSPDLYATDVLASILAGGESSILVRKIRDDQQLVVDINATNDTPRHADGGLEIVATLDPEKILPAQQAILAALNNLIKDGVTDDQLKAAKAHTSASLVYDNQTAEQQASRNAYDFLATGNINFTTTYVRGIESVTAAQVQASAKKYIVENRLLTTALLPLNAADPFAKAAAQSTPAITEAPTKKIVLANGLTLLFTKNTTAPLVAIQLSTLGGLLAETDATNGTGNAMMSLLTRGTTSRTAEQIAELLDTTATSLAGASGNNTFAISAQCLKQHTNTTFDLFTDILLNPKFDDKELEKLRPQLLAAIDQAAEDWFDEGYKITKEEYYKDSPYKRLPEGTAAVVSKLTTAQIRDHYKTFLLNPKQSVLSIAGDIDEETALAFAKKLEAIPARTTPAPLAATSTAAPAHTVSRHTEKKSAIVFLAFPPGATINAPDRHALILLSTHLGGYSSPGGSILHETLRGKGLVYTVQASNIPSVTPQGGGIFMITALGEPDKAAQITAAITQIIANVKANKLTDTQLNVAKDQTITGELLSKQTIAAKAAAKNLDELFGRGHDDSAKFAENIKKITPDQVQTAAQKYLQSPTIITLTPNK